MGGCFCLCVFLLGLFLICVGLLVCGRVFAGVFVDVCVVVCLFGCLCGWLVVSVRPVRYLFVFVCLCLCASVSVLACGWCDCWPICLLDACVCCFS